MPGGKVRRPRARTSPASELGSSARIDGSSPLSSSTAMRLTPAAIRRKTFYK